MAVQIDQRQEGGGADVCAGGVQIVSVGVAISSGVLKFSVDLLRLFQCWFKQYLVVMVGGGGIF